MLERRKFIRVPQSVKISYEVANNPRPKASVARNISKGGISFFAPEFLAAGAILKVKFSLERLSYDGFVKVIWATEDADNERYEIGAEFMNMPKVS